MSPLVTVPIDPQTLMGTTFGRLSGPLHWEHQPLARGCMPSRRHRRRLGRKGPDGGMLLWFAVTCNPTAEWLARQITEAFPWDTAPKYLIRDNDRAFGAVFRARKDVGRSRMPTVRPRGTDHVIPAIPRISWQSLWQRNAPSFDHALVMETRRPMSPLRSTASNRLLIDTA